MTNRLIAPTERALNLWASAIHHSAWGGTAHPSPAEALCDPAAPQPTCRFAHGSEQTYDASRDKYEGRARTRPNYVILAAIESVDRALSSSRAPVWFRRYLLFKYPTTGRYAPNETDQVHEREFVTTGLVEELVGGIDAPQATKCAARTVRAVERAFLRVLARELENRKNKTT